MTDNDMQARIEAAEAQVQQLAARVKQDEDRRRIKMLLVDEQTVMNILMAAYEGPQYIHIPVWEDLPPDTELLGCFYIPEEAAWGFKIRHPSFDPVPLGYRMPIIIRNYITLRRNGAWCKEPSPCPPW